MNLLRLLPATLLCLPLIACGGTSSAPDKSVGKSVAEATSGVGQTVKEAMDDARKDIAQGNIKSSAATCRSTAVTWSPLRWRAWMSGWPAPSSAPTPPVKR